MRFYKIDMQGGMRVERRTSVGLANDIGRFLWATNESPACLVINDGSAFRKVWDEGNDGSGSGLDADTIDTYHAGNSAGQVAVSNGNKCTDLNADLLDDETGSYYLAATNLTGTIPAARLSGTYNINISGTSDAAKYS